MLDNTIAELTRARRAICAGGTMGWPNLGDVTACWLKYKLGVDIDNPAVWTADSSVNKSVAEVIRRLVRPRDLLARNQIEYICEPQPCYDKKKRSLTAWVKVTDDKGKCLPGTPPMKVHLCPPFWAPTHKDYREQTLIHEAVHLTHCAGEGKEDEAVAASIGSPTCVAQFVAATNGRKLDRDEVFSCGWVKGVKPKDIPDRCGAELGPDTDWHPKGPGKRAKTRSELEFDTESGLEFDVSPNAPITVRELANQLTNLVFEARNPKLKGQKLRAGTQGARDWTRILNDEILPALHRHFPEWTLAQLIFFARNPKVRGRFKQLPADQQRKFSKEFETIRAAEVRPLLALQIAQGPVNSRTIFLADTDAFQALPAITRTAAGDELARQFEFVGAADPGAPMRVIILEPRRYPERYNHSDGVIAVTSSLPNAYVNVGFHQQTKNINSTIRNAGGRLSLDESTRVTVVPERMGLAKMSKEIRNIPGIGNSALTRMIGAVSLKELVSFLNEEIIPGGQPRLASDSRKWTEGQQRLVGIALGRTMAHEVRHQYVADPPHAAAGLGSAAVRFFGAGNTEFSNADRTSILAAIQNLESQQGTARVIPTYNNGDDRNGDFPF
jgi:hypothetical protein